MARLRNGTWQADCTIQGKRYREQGFPTKAEAEAWEAVTRANVLAGRAPPPGPSVVGRQEAAPRTYAPQGVTLGDLRAICLGDPEIWKGRKNEKDATRLSEAACKRFGAHTPAETIGAAAVTRWRLDMIAEGKSNQTINNYLNALSRMLRAGEDAGMLTKRPKVQRMSAPKAREWYVAPEAVAALLERMRARDPELADLVLLLVEQGCRASEALGLEWQHVEGRRLRFYDTKNGDDRFAPQTPAVASMLTRRRPKDALPHHRVFPYEYAAYNKRFRPWRDALGVPRGTSLHLLRHTCATALVSAGVDLGAVGVWLGHHDVRTTKRYAKYTDTAMAGVAARIGEVFAGPGPSPEGEKVTVTEVTGGDGKAA
ncbi:site-specific integrase [Roseomonas sp. GC11]|uniref:tyrosine-type recombinase/integrase n=1 Tax=Roseomonas sp. GC11 TaxID=2950546 RepID=UPI002109E80D|nr:site-specific integrase [Roseomonas sp. GC11]MCQ4158742.1 site-specific integrase [Roseomonas sp. GC11]